MPLVRKRLGGFTLMELLISMALLVILAILIFQITSAASGTIRISNRSIDAAAQARLAFDRIALDLSSLVNDGQTGFSAANTAPGDTNLVQFVSEVTSSGTTPGGNRGVSVVAYQVNKHADNKQRICLARAGKAVGWDTAGFRGVQTNEVPLTFTNSSFPAALLPSSTGSPSDFDVLAPGVIRMVVGFQIYPDGQPVELQDGTSLARAEGQIVYSAPVRTVVPTGGGTSVKLPDLNRVSAIVVGLAAIDLETLKPLEEDHVEALSAAFAGIPDVNQLPLAKWMSDTSDLSALPADIPLPARQAVRLYQRSFPVTPHPTQAL